MHPTWGPLKIQASVGRKYPELALPATSTIGELLKREGLVKPRVRRRRTPPCTQPFAKITAPNSVWCVDFKGDFRLGNGTRCYPLTVTDSYSRYLLCCYGLKGTSGEPVQRVLTRVFREFGLPDAWRSDNGTPFASIGIAGLSRLSVWLVKLGIQLERIDPGRPEQNGRHERMHRTLKAEATRPARRSVPAQQKSFDRFRREFNEDRPHEALGQETPASVYVPSPRLFPKRVTGPDYDQDTLVRRVGSSGSFRWKCENQFIGRVLIGESVGVTQVDNDLWDVSFGSVRLGVLDETGSTPQMVRFGVKRTRG